MNRTASSLAAATLAFGLLVQGTVAASAAAPADITGTWNVVLESPHGLVEAEMILEQEAGKVSGTYDADAPVTGTVEGDQVLLSVDLTTMIFEMKGAISGGSKMAGKTVSGGFPWSATRQ